MRVHLLKNQAYFKFNSLNHFIFQNKICSVYFDKRKKYFYSLFVWHHGSFIFLIIYRCIRSPGFCLFLHLTKLHSKLHLFHYFVFLSVVFLFVYCSLNFFPVKIGLINILTFSTHALNYIFNL